MRACNCPVCVWRHFITCSCVRAFKNILYVPVKVTRAHFKTQHYRLMICAPTNTRRLNYMINYSFMRNVKNRVCALLTYWMQIYVLERCLNAFLCIFDPVVVRFSLWSFLKLYVCVDHKRYLSTLLQNYVWYHVLDTEENPWHDT